MPDLLAFRTLALLASGEDASSGTPIYQTVLGIVVVALTTIVVTGVVSRIAHWFVRPQLEIDGCDIYGESGEWGIFRVNVVNRGAGRPEVLSDRFL